MSQNITQPTKANVKAFLQAVLPKEKQKDSFRLCALIKKITGKEGVLWGDSIIGFGKYHYKYKSGREGDWFLTGFSPRKNLLTLYLSCDLSHDDFSFERLGKHKKGKGCLYIKKLADVDLKNLENIIRAAVRLTTSN